MIHLWGRETDWVSGCGVVPGGIGDNGGKQSTKENEEGKRRNTAFCLLAFESV